MVIPIAMPFYFFTKLDLNKMKKSQKVNNETYLQLIAKFWAKQKEIKLSISAIGAYFVLGNKA